MVAGWNLDNSYTQLPGLLFSRISPTPVRNPGLVVFNEPLARELGLDLLQLQSRDGILVFAGNVLPEAAEPIAQAYAGHQYGHFTMLGDGRAILLGEQVTPEGQRFDVQLKGSGRTPYSRRGDGRAALGPMLREYIVSEAMHALGTPTTRSLAVVTTGETIRREEPLPGAILTRVAASHIRVGTFEFVAHWGTPEDLKALADYTIDRHYPDMSGGEGRYLSFLRGVIKRQAELIARWQLVGFVHGVMNTDNMTISGETIDYGPCAFMDAYDPKTVFSSIDQHGRYAYGNQPSIGIWNLARFAESLLPLLHGDRQEAVRMAKEELSRFKDVFHCHWLGGMRTKLGLSNEEPGDGELVAGLLTHMRNSAADYTNTFRALTFGSYEAVETLQNHQGFAKWHEQWQQRLGNQTGGRVAAEQLMRRTNPAVIPRNHKVEEALDAAEQGDLSLVERLLSALKNPYAHSPEQLEFAAPSGRPYRTFCGT